MQFNIEYCLLLRYIFVLNSWFRALSIFGFIFLKEAEIMNRVAWDYLELIFFKLFSWQFDCLIEVEKWMLLVFNLDLAIWTNIALLFFCLKNSFHLTLSDITSLIWRNRLTFSLNATDKKVVGVDSCFFSLNLLLKWTINWVAFVTKLS